MTDTTLAELGLDQPPEDARDWFAGCVEIEDSWVEINATGYDSQFFWTMLVYCADGDRVVRLETGLGPLSDYWPFAVALAEGMVKVVPLIENLADEVGRASQEEPLPPERRVRLYMMIARAARKSGHADTGLRRGAVQIAWDARRELREAERQHPAE